MESHTRSLSILSSPSPVGIIIDYLLHSYHLGTYVDTGPEFRGWTGQNAPHLTSRAGTSIVRTFSICHKGTGTTFRLQSGLVAARPKRKYLQIAEKSDCGKRTSKAQLSSRRSAITLYRLRGRSRRYIRRYRHFYHAVRYPDWARSTTLLFCYCCCSVAVAVVIIIIIKDSC
ncbi:hypothetical protein BJX61DRAFT_87175 [Aspergillus egyptiacus]|nr:hypothetical protein BJX61DRAFT_87175 [Aspergillus egyptiacus]